jgi:hypothetical protein
MTISRKRDVLAEKVLNIERTASLSRKAQLQSQAEWYKNPRQKSHRDFLIDEMQWAAVDFRQELRLKMSHLSSIASMCADDVTSGRWKERCIKVIVQNRMTLTMDTQSTLDTSGQLEEDRMDVAENDTVEPSGFVKSADLPVFNTGVVIENEIYCKDQRKIAYKISSFVEMFWSEELLKTNTISEATLAKNDMASSLTYLNPIYYFKQKNKISDEKTLLSEQQQMINALIGRANIVIDQVEQLRSPKNTYTVESSEILNQSCMNKSPKSFAHQDILLNLRQYQDVTIDRIVKINRLGYGACIAGPSFAGKTFHVVKLMERWFEEMAGGQQDHTQQASGSSCTEEAMKTDSSVANVNHFVTRNSSTNSSSSRRRGVLLLTSRKCLVSWLQRIRASNSTRQVVLLDGDSVMEYVRRTQDTRDSKGRVLQTKLSPL